MLYKVESSADYEMVCKRIVGAMGKYGAADVSIRKPADRLSEEQRGFYWVSVGIIAGERGQTKLDMHRTLKQEFLLPIFLRDEERHPDLAAIRQHMRTLKAEAPETYNKMLTYIVNNTHLADASVDEMREYLDEIDNWGALEGYTLPPPRRREIRWRT